MPHTRLLYHVVFATRDREPVFLEQSTREAVFAGIATIARRAGCANVTVGGWTDHVHMLFEMRASRSLSEVVRDVKANASRWFKEKSGVGGFAWQSEYGAFTVSVSRLEHVRRYIKNQATHHATRSFMEEYRELMEKHGIPVVDRPPGPPNASA